MSLDDTTTHLPESTSKDMATESSSTQQIVFYDIASAAPLHTFAPNPWKTRFALNHKKVSYRTEWTQMTDIHDLRTRLGVPANRTLPDGSAYHTLPVIHDQGKDKLLGDSFEIALYLDQAYSTAPRLFQTHTTGLTAGWNAQVDSLFTPFSALCGKMPFDPAHAEAIYAVFCKRAGVSDWSALQPSPEQREALFVQFEAKLGELAKAYRHTGGTTDHVWRAGGSAVEQRQHSDRAQVGPWLDGEEAPVYADFVVGAWLKMMQASMVPEEWARVSSWQDGLWGRIVEALEPWSEIK